MKKLYRTLLLKFVCIVALTLALSSAGSAAIITMGGKFYVLPTNAVPVAHAGADQSVVVGSPVLISGSTSSDLDGDPLTYSWSITGPVGNTTSLSSTTGISTSFTPDIEGSYTIQLIVNDGTVNSAPDTVTITATGVTNGRPLPDKFIGVFLDVSPIAGAGQVDYVRRSAAKAKNDFQIDVINLVVRWKDIQTASLTNDYQSLHDMIKAIKSSGCYCVLRIYANAGNSYQAWPDFLSIQIAETYRSGSVVNPLPWNDDYYNAYKAFLSGLTNSLSETNNAYPDAVQLIAGGDYGEQVLSGYSIPDYSTLEYVSKLYPVQETHIIDQLSVWQNKTADKIVMVNSLIPENPTKDASVGMFAVDKGVKWVQTNAGACKLTTATYKASTLILLKNINDGANVILEDTYGACSESIQNRLDKIKQIEKDSSITFKGVTISIEDLTIDNSIGISNLRSYIINR